MGYGPWGHEESDRTKQLTHTHTPEITEIFWLRVPFRGWNYSPHQDYIGKSSDKK